MKTYFILPLCLIFSFGTVKAQIALGAENTIDKMEVTNSITGEKTAYSLMRDYFQKDQWYYEPKRIRLAERTVQGKRTPKIFFVKYQLYDKDGNKNRAAGVVSAMFTYAAYDEEEIQMTQQLKKLKGPNSRLAGMRFKTSKFVVLPVNAEFIEAGFTLKVFPGSISGAEVGITIPTTDLGIAVLSKLGVTVQNDLTFNGLTVPCEGSIKGDWKNIYDYVEKEKRAGGGAKFLGIQLGGTYEKNTIKESLKKNAKFVINEVGCENGNTNNAVFENLITTIQNEVFTKNEVNDAENLKILMSALASKNDTLKKSVVDKIKSAITQNELSLRGSYSNNQIKRIKQGSISVNLSKSNFVERQTSIYGELNLRSYKFTDEQLKDFIVEVNMDKEFPEAVFGLPQNFDEFIGIKSVTIDLKAPTGKSRGAIWTVKDGWRYIANNMPISALVFPLLGEDKKGLFTDKEFRATMRISTKFDNTPIEFIDFPVKAFDGVKNYSLPEQMYFQVKVDPTDLNYHLVTKDVNDLQFVKVIIKYEGKTYSRDIKPKQSTQEGGDAFPNTTFLIAKSNTTGSTEYEYELHYKRNNKGEFIIKKGTSNSMGLTLSNTDWKGDY